MAYHRKMVERVMEAEWKTDDEGVRPDFDIGIVLQHLTGVKGVEARAFRQRALVDFDDGDIDAAGHVGRIPPDALAIVEEKDRKPRRAREIVLVDVNLELQSVGMMIVLGVDDDMQAGDEEQAIAVLEKKPVALVNSLSPTKVEIRVVESNRGSIIGKSFPRCLHPSQVNGIARPDSEIPPLDTVSAWHKGCS